MILKLKGTVTYVRGGISQYLHIKISENEEYTVFGYDDKKRKYKVGDKFNEIVSLEHCTLCGKYQPIDTLRLYMIGDNNA